MAKAKPAQKTNIFKSKGGFRPPHLAEFFDTWIHYDHVVNFESLDRASQWNQSVNPDYLLTVPAGIAGHQQVAGSLSMRVAGQAAFEKWATAAVKDKLTEVRQILIRGTREIHKRAVQQAPYETGQLRACSRGAVGGRTVSLGTDQDPGEINPVSYPEGRLEGGDYLTMTVNFWDEPRTKVTKTKGTKVSNFLVSVWTHENLEYHPHTAGTGPKYLESAFAQLVPEIESRIQAIMR